MTDAVASIDEPLYFVGMVSPNNPNGPSDCKRGRFSFSILLYSFACGSTYDNYKICRKNNHRYTGKIILFTNLYYLSCTSN